MCSKCIQALEVIISLALAAVGQVVEKTDIHMFWSSSSEKKDLGDRRYFPVAILVCSDVCQYTHTHTHKHRVLHTSICQPQLPIRGCMGLLILSAEEETCQSLLKMSFYDNHLNNHCVLMRKTLQILLPHILHPRHGPGLLMLKCSPTEGTNDFPSCQAKW